MNKAKSRKAREYLELRHMQDVLGYFNDTVLNDVVRHSIVCGDKTELKRTRRLVDIHNSAVLTIMGKLAEYGDEY